MKKLFLSFAIIFSVSCFSQPQNLDGITVTITLRAGDWAFIRGSVNPDDSLSIIFLQRLRDTAKLANPATFNTNLRFTAMPARLVYNLYAYIEQLPAALYKQHNLGTNINNAIKNINNSTLQDALTFFDSQYNPEFIRKRTLGKNILLD